MKRSLLLAFGVLAFNALPAAVPGLVTVGEPGNSGKDVKFGDVRRVYPRGAVAYPYRIGKSEVSNAEYAAFLNAVAADSDPHKLYDERMGIVRTRSGKGWQYAAAEGKAQAPVNYVSRVNAARYCNYLTSGNVEEGAYTVARRVRENGKEQEVITGQRDTTFPDSATVYFLPDMHEFFKAGWYEGDGKYRTVTAETIDEPSYFGISGHASGVREWMENKYYGANPIALGAEDGRTDLDSLNTVAYFSLAEDQSNDKTGFRVAATAPLQIGSRLNSGNNFFFDKDEPARLRIRHDGAQQTVSLALELRDYKNDLVWERTETLSLPAGVTELPITLPEADGYYELTVTPQGNADWGGLGTTIPLALMREAMPELGAEGNFGFTAHITRRERRFSFEDTDFELLHRLGVSQVRADVNYSGTNGSQEALVRIHEAGLNPLAVITGEVIRSHSQIEETMAKNPELVAKWAEHDVPAQYAWYAENIYNLVKKHEGVVKDWEFGNEPTYWDILSEDYAQSLKAGYKAAKLANPDANVIAGDINAIHAPVFQVGGGNYSDGVATHIYGFYVPMFWGIAGKMRELNGWMEAAGIAEQPVWITEIGGATYNSSHLIPVREMDEVRRYQALHQPKVMAGGMAFGASKVIPYNMRDVPVDYYEAEFGMIDRTGLPKPAIATYRNTARLLGDATFVGFVEGHSLKAGEIAGLHFRDGRGEDVLVFWRNDIYGYGRFDVPFFETIGEEQFIEVPAAGTSVEAFDMSGGRSELAVKGGKVRVGVSEYPVYVRGRLNPAHEQVQTAHPVPAVTVPAAKVKIRPNYRSRACDLMSGVVLRLTENSYDTVQVSIYNTRTEPLSGTLRLVPKSNWREWPWEVLPQAEELKIMPEGMATASFKVKIPAVNDPAKIFYLDAIFQADDGSEFRDTVAFHILGRQMPAGDWVSYTKGATLRSEAGNTEIRIGVPEGGKGFVNFYRRSLPAFAANAQELNKDVLLSVKPQGLKVGAVSLLFRDSGGEIFQLKQNVSLEDNQWQTLRFHAAGITEKGVIVHSGGNGKVDFPVSLLGFNFDHGAVPAGASVLVAGMEVTEPASLWRRGAWNVYGDGYRIKGISADQAELSISRQGAGRAYASLVSTNRPVIAETAREWPQNVAIGVRSGGIDLTSVSLLLVDAGGETFQLKQKVDAPRGIYRQVVFDLQAFASNSGLIIYGGDGNKKIDYPVRLFGFNFDFARSDKPVELTLNAPQIDIAAGAAGSGGASTVKKPVAGGGAADMD